MRIRFTMPIDPIVKCPNCGAKNRVSSDKLGRGLSPKCARCGAPLPARGAGPIEVTDATFAKIVERSRLPVLLDLWAPWCGPCRMIAPMLEKLASEMGGRVRFAKLNVDQNPSTAARFRADAIPTLLVLKNGREVDRIVGVRPEGEIRRVIERHAS